MVLKNKEKTKQAVMYTLYDRKFGTPLENPILHSLSNVFYFYFKDCLLPLRTSAGLTSELKTLYDTLTSMLILIFILNVWIITH